MRKPLAYVFSLLSILLGLWLVGLIFYARDAEPEVRRPLESLPIHDAIIVLTGGAARIETGLALLQAGKGQKLFISGVHPHAAWDAVLPKEPVVSEAQRACCIHFGRTATNTLSNAAETTTWLQQQGFRNFILVTAGYHMQRSLVEFSPYWPRGTITPWPAQGEKVRLADWWNRPQTAVLLVREYNKLLLALARRLLNSAFPTPVIP